MIISRRRQYILVHIPKTGGTALTLALEGRAAADDILIGDTPKARARRGRLKALHAAGRLWKHSTLADIDGVVTPADLTAFFTLTLVRNPWDRMLSYYTWLRVQAFAHPAVGLAKLLEFKAFVAHPQTQASLAAWPSGRYMQDRSGTERCRLYARMECPEDLDPFWTHLGFRLALPRVNEGLRPRDWRPAYDDATAALVGDLAAADVARFGYGFDDAGRR